MGERRRRRKKKKKKKKKKEEEKERDWPELGGRLAGGGISEEEVEVGLLVMVRSGDV